MFLLKDYFPSEEFADAVYIPGFCLTYSQKKLTDLNVKAMEAAIAKVARFRANHIIYSGCYDGEPMRKELLLRGLLVSDLNIDDERIHEIKGIVNTKHELNILKRVIEEIGAKSVLLVSDKWHLPRLVRWAKSLMPKKTIYYISVSPRKYEFAWEPNILKVIRSGIKPLWILWNWALWILSPK